MLSASLLEFLDKVSILKTAEGSLTTISERYQTATQECRYKNKNSAAVFILSAAHLLNLVEQAAASCCVEAVNYFCCLYLF